MPRHNRHSVFVNLFLTVQLQNHNPQLLIVGPRVLCRKIYSIRLPEWKLFPKILKTSKTRRTNILEGGDDERFAEVIVNSDLCDGQGKQFPRKFASVANEGICAQTQQVMKTQPQCALAFVQVRKQ